MDVNKLLEDLQEYVESRPLARHFNRALFVDVSEIKDYIDQIRVSLPPQIQRADQITREKERILAEAREQAERMVTEAAEQAELTIRKAQEDSRILVSSHEITRQATQEGQRLVEQAKREAEEIREGALEYARNVMENLHGAVTNLASHVANLQDVSQQAREKISTPH